MDTSRMADSQGRENPESGYYHTHIHRRKLVSDLLEPIEAINKVILV